MTIVGPGTPYITPDVLTSRPTGISWATIPSQKATPDQQLAAQLDICKTATDLIDGYCGTPLRATIDTEIVRGPDDLRFVVQPNGVARIILSRPPVVSVLSGQIGMTATFPSNWTSLAADQFKVEIPLIGVYGTTAPGAADAGGQAILLAPGRAARNAGRYGYELQVTYLNGWPHAMLTADAAAGATSIQVDDVTGWTGAVGTIMDSTGQEAASVTATSPSGPSASGPGTLTLASGLANAHKSGTLVTTLPGTVIQAAVLYAVSQALVRGGTALSIQTANGAVHKGSDDYSAEAELLIHPFRRTL